MIIFLFIFIYFFLFTGLEAVAWFYGCFRYFSIIVLFPSKINIHLMNSETA